MRKPKKPSTLVIKAYWESEPIPEEILIELAADISGNEMSENDLWEESHKIAIVIDGFQVRSHLAPTRDHAASGSAIVSWLDRLCFWAFENSDATLRTIVSIVAWDGELEEGDETKASFKKLGKETQSKFLQSRRDSLQIPDSDIAQASWHFLPLVVRDDHWDPRQSGVDARIAAALLRSAIEGCNQLILVTRDADYEDAIHLINEKFPTVEVDVVTMGFKPPAAFERCACRRWKGSFRDGSLKMQRLEP